MNVRKSSIFPADINKVFLLLQQFDTLQFIAAPFATFESLSEKSEITWKAGAVFSFAFKLFGSVSLGEHQISVVRFDKDGIYTNEGNSFCPIWNHRINLVEIDESHTQYTDEVEIDAGWKTPFVYLWAKAFYSHRQKKWLKLLS